MLGEKPKAILFDWDNTLIHGWPAIYNSYHTTFEKMGLVPWTLEEVKSKVHLSMKDFFPIIFGDKWDQAAKIYKETFKKTHLDYISSLEQSEETLKLIQSKNIPAYVISNKHNSFLIDEVKHMGWEKYFIKIIGAGYAKEDKPSPIIVDTALDGSGIDPNKDIIWFIGDSISDMKCAYNSSCKAIFYGVNYFDIEKYKEYKPQYYIKDHSELITILNNFNT